MREGRLRLVLSLRLPAEVRFAGGGDLVEAVDGRGQRGVVEDLGMPRCWAASPEHVPYDR